MTMSEAIIMDPFVIRRFLRRWGKPHFGIEFYRFYDEIIAGLHYYSLCDELCEVINEGETLYYAEIHRLNTLYQSLMPKPEKVNYRKEGF